MPSVTPKINPKNRNVEGFDQLLRRFKKECERANIVQECRDRKYHIKPNTIKNEKNQQLKRRKKLEAKRASMGRRGFRGPLG